MAILALFLLGIGNFALHKAVIESDHPLLGQMRWLTRGLSGRASLWVEFAILLGALLLVSQGEFAWGWVYFLYTLVNGFSAWLILTRRL